MSYMKTMAERLGEARRNCGKTQQWVAEKMDISTQSVSAWECGSSMPDIEKIPELAALYGVTTDWLLMGKHPSKAVLDITSNLSDRLFSESRMATYVSAYCDAAKLYQTKRSLAFARDMHSGQFRKEGHGDERIPYIYHPLLLTCHALALGLAEDDLLSACLLHDVCEDCGLSPEDLPVNEETREAVRLLTKPAAFGKSKQEYRTYYEGIAGNRIALIVKLLDRCNNVSSMATCFTEERMAEYIRETMEYFPPLIEKARKEYPQYSSQLFLIRYHMNSVLEALRHHMKSAL